MSGFFRRLEQRVSDTGTFLCVGLDPRQEEMTDEEHEMLRYDPTIGLFHHGKRILDATSSFASSWKINAAFYEAWGSAGWLALERLVPLLTEVAPVLLDGKRGDIGSTVVSYAKSAVNLGVQAVTVSPYLGRDTVKPFIDHGLDVFMLIRTSNPSAADVQDHPAAFPTWRRILEDSMEWSDSDRLGYVVAANDSTVLRDVRKLAPGRWLLSPGVGVQGASIRDVTDACGGDTSRLLVPISRGISGAEDPGVAASKFASQMRITSKTATPDPRPIASLRERVANSLFDSGCVKFGTFTLKSGITSPVYLDLRRLISYPDLLAQVAELYKHKLQEADFDVVAALPYAALPIGTAISLAMNKPMIYPRREQKEHGTRRLIEGNYGRGTRAVVIDDVVTGGDSKVDAISVLESEGVVVDDVCVLIDRLGGGRQLIEKIGKRLMSIYRFDDLLNIWLSSNRISKEQFFTVKRFLGM